MYTSNMTPLQKKQQQGDQKVTGSLPIPPGEALRTLALAVKFDLHESNLHDYDGPNHPKHALLCDPSNFASVERGMTFLGMVGIIDPPRPECMDAISACKQAGVLFICCFLFQQRLYNTSPQLQESGGKDGASQFL